VNLKRENTLIEQATRREEAINFLREKHQYFCWKRQEAKRQHQDDRY
jgi:hypothetical protein